MTPRAIAHYRITGKLGEGGMGEVYRATDTKLGRDVAIKVIPEIFAQDADRMARFAREAHLLAALNHPNIAAIYGIEDHAIVMELVEGPTLAERIGHEPIPLVEALPIARQIAEALEYAHEKGIIHRDLKPANIKVTADGKVKVLDFGLAKALTTEQAAGAPASSPTLTMRATLAGVIMGTAAYMSPEQARGGTAERRADIWAFGVVLYEMLTGRQMFAGDTVSDTLAAVLKTEPDWSALPAETPASIRRLLRRCLERDRKRRLPDIADARLEIDEALAGSAESPAAAAPPHPQHGFRWWTAALAVAAAAGIAVAVVHFREIAPQPVPLRFQIPAPEKADFGNTGMAVSPDGRRLAFIAGHGGGVDGRTMLWVRQFDSLAAQALPGTEGAGSLPFWSPDSRFIGFSVQGKLKKIEASGGPPQTLCEIPGTILGGSWSREGVIIIGSLLGGLYRVPQAGGAPTGLTKLDSAQGESAHVRPWFLPDGRHFLYTTRTRQPENQTIFLAALDGSPRKRLVGSKQGGAYAPPAAGSEFGHLLFLRDGTLMALPLDARRFEPAGEPFPLAEQVGASFSLGFFSVSANGMLTYRAGGFAGTQLAWFDRAGTPLATLGPPGLYGGSGSLALSPDGKRVAVDLTDAQTGNRDIWIFDVARGVPSRFTFDAAQEAIPVWSPDGTRLLFSSDRDGGIFDIYQKDASRSANEELLLKSGNGMRPYDWSRTGRNILYGISDPKTGWDLWVLPDPTGVARERKPAPYLRTPFNETQGQFSPDGHWIAYTSDEAGPGQYQIYVQSFPSGAGTFQISAGAGGTQPRWRRDGKELFYVAADAKLMAVEVKTAPKFEAGAPKALFDSRIAAAPLPNLPFRYDVTADGKRFLLNTLANGPESSAGGPITVVTNWTASVRR